MKYTRHILLLILLHLLVGPGASFGQQAQTSDRVDLNTSFENMQRELNTQLIEYARQQVGVLNSMRDYITKEQYDSAWDVLPDVPQIQQQLRKSRGDDEFNYLRARLDSLKLKTLEAESKKSELKARVLDYNKQFPQWWERAEAAFLERRRQLVQSGIRR